MSPGVSSFSLGMMIQLKVIFVSGMIIEFNDSRIGLFDNKVVFVIELIFIGASTLEIVLKLIADGLIFTPNGLVTDFADALNILHYCFSLTYVILKTSVIPRYSAAYW